MNHFTFTTYGKGRLSARIHFQNISRGNSRLHMLTATFPTPESNNGTLEQSHQVAFSPLLAWYERGNSFNPLHTVGMGLCVDLFVNRSGSLVAFLFMFSHRNQRIYGRMKHTWELRAIRPLIQWNRYFGIQKKNVTMDRIHKGSLFQICGLFLVPGLK